MLFLGFQHCRTHRWYLMVQHHFGFSLSSSQSSQSCSSSMDWMNTATVEEEIFWLYQTMIKMLIYLWRCNILANFCRFCICYNQQIIYYHFSAHFSFKQAFIRSWFIYTCLWLLYIACVHELFHFFNIVRDSPVNFRLLWKRLFL